MPNFTDYLFAPWKILSFLASGTQSHPGAPGVPAGSFCGTQDIGGQMINVCHVLGYEMPGFVFTASMIILALFVAASIYLLYQCLHVAAVLNRVARQFERLPLGGGKDGFVNGRELASIRALMSKHGFLSHAWRQFEDTLLISPQGEEVFSTQSVESILSKPALVEENIHTALFNAVPGVLTGLGLLMTFVAILDGLSHVSVAANMDVTGIGGLINGLSGKFISSIVAVTCAVFFVFVERIGYAQPHRAYHRLLSRIASRFRRRTAEHLLYHIQHQLVTQAALQREFAQTLAQLQQPVKAAERASRGT